MPEQMPFTQDEFFESIGLSIKQMEGYDAHEFFLGAMISPTDKFGLNSDDTESRYIHNYFIVTGMRIEDEAYIYHKTQAAKLEMWEVAEKEVEANPNLKYLMR